MSSINVLEWSGKTSRELKMLAHSRNSRKRLSWEFLESATELPDHQTNGWLDVVRQDSDCSAVDLWRKATRRDRGARMALLRPSSATRLRFTKV